MKQLKMANRDPFIFEPSPPQIKAHFQTSPWALKYFNDPSLQPFTTESRIPKTHNTQDTFCATTLATDDTIIAWQSFYKPPPTSSSSQYGELLALFKLGSGVNGHIDTCHGGFLSVVLDELIGNVAEYERPPGKSTMTAYLKVDYKRPVPTPSIVVSRAWLEKIEGRKIYGRGVIEDEEGNVCATGEALFLTVEKITAKPKVRGKL